MDKIQKALEKLSQKEKERLKEILHSIENNNFENLDIKKLKGKDNVFRVRKGDLRIIFCKKDSIKILTIERRSIKTYNF